MVTGKLPPLIEVDELSDVLTEGAVTLIDGTWRLEDGTISAKADFEKERIPGAVFFDLDEIADRSCDLPHMLASPDAFAAAAGGLGVSESSALVIYDQTGLFSAARVWWTFLAFGHRGSVSVLNGGLPAWRTAGGAIERGASQSTLATYARPERITRIANAADVRGAIKSRTAVIADARPGARFTGDAAEPRAGLRPGTMPGAVSTPASALVGADGKLKPTSELEEIFAAAGVNAETPVITTCGSGVTAAIISLALAVTGRDNWRLYDGAWAEWGRETNDPAEFPVITRSTTA